MEEKSMELEAAAKGRSSLQPPVPNHQ
jgi:hypothetical protein